MNRGALSACLVAFAILIPSLHPAHAQDAGPVLIKEVVTREYSVHVGGVQTPDPKDLVSREASLYVENGPADPHARVISREVSLGVASAATPPPITDVALDVSPTGETVTLDWGAYNQWALGDIARFDIYFSDDNPVTDVSGLTPLVTAPGGATSLTLDGLTPFTDHYIAIVPVDLLGNFDPLVSYSAAYVLSPQAMSREVSLHVGGEPTPPHRQVISREVSLVAVSAEVPPAIDDLSVTTSPTGDSATLDWSGYNPWAVGDIDHFAIYQSDAGPITDVSGMTPILQVSGEALGVTLDGLTPFVEHYFAVVPVDGQGQLDPAVSYAAAYVLSPQSISREVSLFVGDDPDSPYAQAISREVSILVPDAAVPAPVTGLDSGFFVETSRDAFGAVDMDWTSYKETAQLDVARYLIYVGPAFFDDVTGLTPFATVPAGTQLHTLTGLAGGAILHFAVVAEDALGNFDPTVRSFSAKASISGVGEVMGLSVVSAIDSLTFTWEAPPDAGSFLSHYHLYFAGATEPLVLPSSATSWQGTGLDAATGYPLRLATVDVFGNESDGTSLLAATILPNPANLTMSGVGSTVSLYWNGVHPAALVKHYAIYRASTPINDVSALAPIATRTGTSLTVGTFDEIRDQYFAVATVNMSDVTDPRVTSVFAGDFEDLAPPVVDEVRFGSQVLGDGATLTRPNRLTVLANDPSGIARVDLSVNGSLLAADFDGTDGFGADWDISALADGAHLLEVRVRDGQGNQATLSYDLVIALGPPPAPVLSQPPDGFTTNAESVTVAGSTVKDATAVTLYRNGTPAGSPIPAPFGSFQSILTLEEGTTQIQAAASNRGGEGALSAPVAVTVDKSIPDSPIGLYAEAKAGGEVRLSWSASRDSKVVGYALYRLDAPFTDVASATRIDGGALVETRFADLPPADGAWFYRVTAVNDVGAHSEPSNQASATADSVLPVAILIEYQPTGPYDDASGRFGVGRVDITVHLSEEPETTPFLSIAPAEGIAQTVPLTWALETSYIGHFYVNPGTPSGIAHAVFSARDQAGNRGTEIVEGGSIEIDTDGPIATAFTVTPEDPIRNQPAPVEVQVRFGLSEPLGDGQMPTLSYRLSGEGREDVDVILAQDGDEWTGSFLLPSDAGQAAPEFLTFACAAVDVLYNLGTEIQGPNGLQVYQGELPPPETPRGLTARALPGGEVLLGWEPVEDVLDYQIYRAGPGVGDAAALTRSGGALEWTDQPGVDGVYRYSVASVREANGQESLSAPSPEVEVSADSVPPDAPTGLILGVLATGVESSWDAAADTDTLTYSIYALPGDGLGGLGGTEPVLTGVELTSARDPYPPAPQDARITYLVTALDPAGNESDTTAWGSVNLDLLPVASMEVEQIDDGFPFLSWTHANEIAGVDLYLGDKETGLKLNQAPLPGPGYEDMGWSGGAREYSLVALDDLGGESLPRSLTLPHLSAELDPDSTVKRGIMNRVAYLVTNEGSEIAEGVTLALELNGRLHRSTPTDIPAGETRGLDAVVGGYSDLPDPADISVTLEQTPNPGEHVRILRTEQIEITDGVLLVDLLTRDMTRGGAGQVRFALENITDVGLQIVTAIGNGAMPSDDIRISLLDSDGNSLSGVGFHQDVGASLRTLEDGRTIAEIPPGGRFESDWLDLPIPSAAPNSVEVVLDIDQLHYHLGQSDGVSIAGIGSRREVTLIDTSYVGELIGIDPEHRFGPGTIGISGRSVLRASGEPLGRVPLSLIVAGVGYERLFEMFTGEDGIFDYDYEPLAGESGTFRVSVIHPDLLERPEQGSFSIGTVVVEPLRQDVVFPRHTDKVVLLDVATGRELPAAGVRLEYLEEDQVFGTFEPGITVTPGDPIDLPPEGAGTLSLILHASDEAHDSGPIMLRLVSDESPDIPLARVRLDYNLSSAGPALFPAPTYLELGAAPGDRATGSLVLSSQGLADVTGLRVSLLLAATQEQPDWAFISSTPDLGALGIGESTPVDITIAPTDAVPEDIHELIIRVSADNHATFDIPVYAYVTRAGVGSVLFHVSDIFTATLDENDEPIRGLQGARIEVQHEKIGSINYEGTTDELGEALFEDLVAGSYLFRASAPNHSDVAGRLTIRPGVTEAREVFLDYGLISLEWEVTEITIEDRYEVVLHLTYETDVPAPVVVIEPPGITLPEMVPGQVLQGEFNITNYGLVRADDVQFTPAPDDAYFDYEFMADIPQSIEAKERISVPYRIVALRPLVPSSDQDTGGAGADCGYGTAARLVFKFPCANGVISGGGTGFGIHANVGADCGEPVGCGCGGGGSCRGYSGGSGGGGGGGFPLIPCPPECKQKIKDCCDRYGAGGGGGGGGEQ